MILPAAAAKFWASEIGGLITVAAAIAIMSSLIGLLLSYHFNVPSSPAIILVAGIGYGLSLVFGPVGGLITQSLPNRHLQN